MLPIVRFPRVIEQQVSWFDPVFVTDEQRKHFREYVTGLITSEAATVTAINNLFLGHNDQSALNKFLTLAEWDETELNRRQVQMELARLDRRPVSATAGWDSAISRVGGHPLETTTGDRTGSKITSTHTILTAKWNSTQQLKVLETRSTHTLRQTSWVEPPDTGFVSNLDGVLAIPGGDITGLVALSRTGIAQ